MQNYRQKLDTHVRPVLGGLPVAKIDAETLESFYSQLRKCSERCRGRKYVTHRKAGEHECTERCRPHACRPLAANTVRQIHWILSGAFGRAARWRWIAVNPADLAEPPGQPAPDPDPPSPAEAARIINAAWVDPDWGALLWLAMTTGARRGELCALRWHHVDLDAGVLSLRRSVYLDENNELQEKDTKTHQQRRIALDPETLIVLAELRQRWLDRLAALGEREFAEAYVFSPLPDNSASFRPHSITQRYGRLAKRLNIESNLHELRHYSATELIAAGVDVRTVAGRLCHGGGGATTLKVYAAWLSESDQRAASTLTARMPTRPTEPTPSRAELSPFQRVAALIREEIHTGKLKPGDQIPTLSDLAGQYGISSGTAHRAVAQLKSLGLVEKVNSRKFIVQPQRLSNYTG